MRTSTRELDDTQAIVFVSRCQNLPGEHHDQPFARKSTADDKGGFVYNPVLGEKEAAQAAEKGLRSAGSMTYAGLKSFLYAGVSKEDPRVQGALGWIRAHYTLDENPGWARGAPNRSHGPRTSAGPASSAPRRAPPCRT